MGGAKAKPPPENMVSIAAVNAMNHSPAASSSTTTAGAVAPILPPFVPFKETHWTCPKCHMELLVTTKRCGTCRTWKGGKRGLSTKKTSKPVNNKTTPPSKNNARITKTSNKDGIIAAVNVIHTGIVEEFSPIGQSPTVEGLDDVSMSLNSFSTMQDSLMQVMQDEDDNTETREIRDNRILQLQDEDNQYDGDGGTSDAEGIGFDDVQGFRDDMMEATFDQLNNGDEDVEDGILDLEEHAMQCVVTNESRGRQLSNCMEHQGVGHRQVLKMDGHRRK